MPKRIYVGNLPFSMESGALEAMFGRYGKVSKVGFMVDNKTGRPTNVAFVEMDNDAQAKAAIQALHQTDMGGRCLNVNEMSPPDISLPRGG